MEQKWSRNGTNATDRKEQKKDVDEMKKKRG
jgi:hypothetical protein